MTDELVFVSVMAQLGRDDRELYRIIRAAAWELVQLNHAKRSTEEMRAWKRIAS